MMQLKGNGSLGTHVLKDGQEQVQVIFVESRDLVQLDVLAQVELLLGDGGAEEEVGSDEQGEEKEGGEEALEESGHAAASLCRLFRHQQPPHLP